MFLVHYLCSEALLTRPPIPESGLGRNRGSFPKLKSYYHSTCSFFGSFSSFGPAGYIYTPLPLAIISRLHIALVTRLQFHVIKKTSDLDWLAVCLQQSCSVQQCCRRQLLPDTLLRRVWPPLVELTHAHTATARVSPHVHSKCTIYVLYAYLYCIYALVGGAISIRDPYICAVHECANESHAVFHKLVDCAVKT